MLKPRAIIQEIKPWLFEKEMVILNGARQTGKTSLLKLLQNELVANGIDQKQIFYLNLEELKILEALNKDPENLLNYIIVQDKTNFFLLDEIQYLDNPSNFLKHIYDKYASKIKIIATGSSSLELKAKLQDSLVGRKLSFLINPLNFEEFLIFKEFVYFDYLKKQKLPEEIANAFYQALDEYLIYGGMPAVVLQKDKILKKKLLEEYISAYINKDIRYIGNIDNITSFNNLVKILSSQIGNLLNINELSNTANISRRNTEKYLNLLEYTFVLDRIYPFKSNIRSQIVKMPKIYFFDLGMRNAILGNFLIMENREDKGALFENFVYLELKNKSRNKIYFYRTINKSEIDFVVSNNENLAIFEVKFKTLNKPIDHRVLKNFIETEKRNIMPYVINLNFIQKCDKINYIDFRFSNI
ncbi:MAG: ATP-binding protein [Candidatus Falkowbacteria bacterium]